MKKSLFTAVSVMIMEDRFQANAQNDMKKEDEKEAQEIIIRKKGKKDANLTIQINGDKVLINGKPLVEFNDDGITVNKRKVIVRGADGNWFGDGMGEDGYFGNFSWSDDDNENGAFLGVTTSKTKDGAKITDVTEESAADKGGLKEDDIITKVGDSKIDGPESLSKAIHAKKPKDEVTISYLRDGKDKTTKVTLQERKTDRRVYSFSGPDGSYKTLTIPAVPPAPGAPDVAPRPYIYNDGDFDLNMFPARKKLGLRIQDTEDGNGVKVLDVQENSAAATAGVKKDDIVTEIAGVKVANTDDAREQLQENNEKSSYTIKAKRSGKEMSFDIKIPKKLKTANL